MGCGKSSVGRELSELLSLPFIDLDGYIEEHEGRSVREIFAVEGETAFRKLEFDALKEILLQEGFSESGHETTSEQTSNGTVNGSDKTDCPQVWNMVLSLGGGTLTTPECAELIAAHTLCIYLKASPATLLPRLEHQSATRPMLKSASPETDTGTLPNPQPDSSGSSSKSSIGEAIPGIQSESPSRRLLRRITTLLSQREPLYEATARHTISTDGLSIPRIAAAVAALLAHDNPD